MQTSPDTLDQLLHEEPVTLGSLPREAEAQTSISLSTKSKMDKGLIVEANSILILHKRTLMRSWDLNVKFNAWKHIVCSLWKWTTSEVASIEAVWEHIGPSVLT